MTFCRSASLGRLTNILVPWMKPVGFARNLSRLASSQVTLAFFIAAEKSNPGTVPLLLPTIPPRDGPVFFSPGVVAWHTAQCDAKPLSPAVASPAASAAEDVTRGWMSSRPAVIGDSFISRAPRGGKFHQRGAQCVGLNLSVRLRPQK